MLKLLILPLLMCTFPGFGQTAVVKLPEWRHVALDNAGRLYIVTPFGDLIRQDLEGSEPPLIYSPVKKARISLVDVSNSLRTFLFYEDLQEYVLLDRFLTETSRYSLVEITSYAGIAAPALNNQLWIVDMVDFSIKKVDTQFNQVLIRIPLPQVLSPEKSDFTFLREYQNLLFLTDANSGIYVFDNMGNFLRQINITGLETLRFSAKHMYYQMSETVLVEEDIYSGERREIELKVPVKTILVQGESFWLVQEREMESIGSP
jgi:hypothetical protein